MINFEKIINNYILENKIDIPNRGKRRILLYIVID